MIDNFSIKHGEGIRVLCLGTDPKWVAVTIGDGSYISDANIEYGSTNCHVLIGNYCSIAHRVTFEFNINFDYHSATTYSFDESVTADLINGSYYKEGNKCQIIIGNDVWIGCDVIILGGVHIGNGAVIGAGAVVTEDVPPYSIVVGNPARVIKSRFEPQIIQRLQNIKWWYWPVDIIKAKYPLMKEMDKFLDDCKDIGSDEKSNEAVQTMKLLKDDGYYIYYMMADFQKMDQIWDKVLIEYLNSFSDDNKVLLVVGVNEKNNEALEREMSRLLDERGNDAPIVIAYNNDNGSSLGLYQLVDTFITTKDGSSSAVVDFMSGMKARVVFGLDNEGHIFDASPAKKRERPLLTIGIPTWNRCKKFERCLKSIIVEAGNDDSIEILISDNASTDDTAEIIDKYKRQYSNLKVVRQRNNIGAEKNFEFIWKNASGEYVNLIGDDDYICPGVIKAWKNVLNTNHQISIGVEKPADSKFVCEFGEGINEYVSTVSYLTTYISGFILKTDLVDIDRFHSKMKECGFDKYRVQQIAMQFEVLHQNPKFAYMYGSFFHPESGDSVFVTPDIHVQVGTTTGFNDLGRVFVKEYFDILEYYSHYGLTKDTIREDKKNSLCNFLFMWSKLVAAQRVRWSGGKILHFYDKYYAQEPYYYNVRVQLADILKNLDPRIKEVLGDSGE